MEAEFYMAILSCFIFGNLEGFQIVHVQKQQCLFLNEKVVVGSCNGTSQNQQWRWTQDGKLLHAKSAQCLAVSNISGGPSRAVTVTSCSQAPWWTCYEQEGFLEMENASFFLKKQGPRVVVKKGKKYLHSWMKIDVNTEGKLVNGSLCLKKADLGADVSVRSPGNTAPPHIPTTFKAVSHHPEHLTRNTTEAFVGNTTENYSQSSTQRHQPGVTDTSWTPSTTLPFSSTTEEIGLAEPMRCNFTLTESRVSSRSVSLQWRSSGSPCNFSLSYGSDTSGAEWCHPIRIDNTTFGCNPQDLQAGTTYHFRIVSLDGEEKTVVLQTDPSPPARFEVDQGKTTLSSLHVWWTPSVGKVTGYELQLFDDDSQHTQEAQVHGSTSWSEYTFFNLTAGKTYSMAITAVSGDKRSSPVYTNGSTVPSPVKDIAVSAKTDSLLISWSRGAGNVEQYRVTLTDKGVLVQDTVVDKHATSHAFQGLIPGKLYNLTIVTEAAGLQNHNWRLVRMAPMEVSDLKVTNDGSLTSLKVRWQRPRGNLDSYNITLSHQGTPKESRVLAPQVTETHFKDLTPGRLYQVTISCVSGELSAQKAAVGRTVPDKVRNLEASNSGWMRSLVVSWSPPAGDWEQYQILLYNDSSVLLNTTVRKEETRYALDDVGLIPGRQYDIEVTVHSGNLKNSERCQGRTVPLPVLQLRVKHANETSLSIMWQTPAAEWENYIISLNDRDLLIIHKSLSKDAKEFTFSDLVPGRNYLATVTTISGDLKNSSSVKGRTVPAQVTGLHVTNQGMTSSLFTNWTQALGDIEFYQVLLIHENVVIKNESVSSETSRYNFHSLKPGSLYSVVVTTVSGGISSRQVVVEARTAGPPF